MSPSRSPSTINNQHHLRTQPSDCALLRWLPPELHINILTYLRAYDLTSVQRTCQFLHAPRLMHSVIQHTATSVYSPELTEGFHREATDADANRKEQVAGDGNDEPVPPLLYTIQHLRNMELLVVARVLSRPEPHQGGFYVSRSWCKQALKWLEVQQESLSSTSSNNHNNNTKKKKKLSKKQQRIRNRRLSDVSPPWPNANADLVCEHSNLQRCNSTKASRARRKRLDKHAWKILKKLYPDSLALECSQGECVQCLLEEECQKRQEADRVEQERLERKRPLGCPLVRGIYTRTRGVPPQCLKTNNNHEKSKCPLIPGKYYILPRSWLYNWRRYLKTGDGERPCAPCASRLLCDAHRLPLIPPHLEAFLRGETSTLLATSNHRAAVGDETVAAAASPAVAAAPVPVGMDPDANTLQALRAAGLSPAEVASQRMAMMRLEQQRRQQVAAEAAAAPPQAAPSSSCCSKDQLDRENSVVVELLTQQEFVALEQWWPRVHSNFCLVVEVKGDDGHVVFSTPPCRECDASGSYSNRTDLYVKNRARGWIKKSSDKSRAPASLEY